MKTKVLYTLAFILLITYCPTQATITTFSDYTVNFTEAGYTTQIISIPANLNISEFNSGIGIVPTNMTGGIYAFVVMYDESADVYANYTQYGNITFINNSGILFTNFTVGMRIVFPSRYLYNATQGDPNKFLLATYFEGEKGTISFYCYLDDQVGTLNAVATPFPILFVVIPLLFVKLRKPSKFSFQQL